MIMSRRIRSFTLVSSFLALAAASVGCANAADDTVSPRLEIVDRTKSALTAGTITAITGTYGAACDGRDAGGTDTWTYDVAVPGNTDLTVRTNDDNCILSVTNVLTADGTFVGTPAIPLDTADTFEATASAFAKGADPVNFYGNAKVSSLAFAADFTITLLVSDTPNASDEGDKAATFATESSTLQSSTVTASNYTIGFGGFTVEKDVNSVVMAVSGSAQLTEVSAPAEDYAVHDGALTGASTLAEIEAAYAAVPGGEKGLLSGLTSLQIPADQFGLLAVDLDTTTQRTVILRHTVDGVTSYQLLMITFTP